MNKHSKENTEYSGSENEESNEQNFGIDDIEDTIFRRLRIR